MDKIITLDYGSGGKKTSSLIENYIVPAFRNDALETLGDGAILAGSGKLVFSTDSFVVSPYVFPGGDIGKLAICGTVNDIAVSGGDPKYLSLALIIEEGFPENDPGCTEGRQYDAGQTGRTAVTAQDPGQIKEVEGIEDEDGKAYQPGQSKPGSAATKRNGKVRRRSGAAGVKSPDFFL